MKFPILRALLFSILFVNLFTAGAQTDRKQKGLLWQISGNGLKKPSYVYGTMHVSQKIAFHLGDSFYIALSKSDIVALEQDLDSVIHRWISESEFDDPDDAHKVYPRNNYDFLTLYHFTLNSYNKALIQRKLSAQVREVNYLLTRGEQDDFEEDTWLDLYIYQLAKKLGKGFTGVEGYEESRELVKKAQKEPRDAKDKKKPRRNSYKLRQQVAEAYRKGDIYMLDSIDRMTESEHYLEYMLYRRNANMVRRMDSIMKQGKTLFTGVGCSHLPGTKGVIQMLADLGYTLRPVQSIALEKSSMARKYENMTVKHRYSVQRSEDGLLSAMLPTRLTKVNDNSFYSSYLAPDLANGYYYQIEKITCNTVFSGKAPAEVLQVIDTLIFENIPGEIIQKKNIVSNGFEGIEVVTRLKTGDLNRFQILASPFNVYIIRMAGKKNFALSKDAGRFFSTLLINEGGATGWRSISSPDSVFSLELPTGSKENKLPMASGANPSYEHLVFDRNTGNTYLIKQEDILNEHYLEQDSFELNVMARSFAATDNFHVLSHRHFIWQGYNALEAVFENKNSDQMLARFVICGTRYLMFLLKPNSPGADFSDRYFSSIRFNGKPAFTYFDYYDTSLFFRVSTPVMPLLTKEQPEYNMFSGVEEEEEKDNPYKGLFREEYFTTRNSNDLVVVGAYRYGTYESQNKKKEDYYRDWKKSGSLLLLSEKKETRNGIDYVTYCYTDTNTTRQFRVMHVLHGKMRYYVEAYLDTVSGKNQFVENFFRTFSVGDTLLSDDIFRKKGYRFFADFNSGDSARRKASISNFGELSFDRNDVKDLCNIVDSISMKGDAAPLRQVMIATLGSIDSASDVVVPCLTRLYHRFTDTAHMQILILRAMALQRSDKAFQAIKPILASDIPISDNPYEMREMLASFGDSLQLTRIILPELIELTGINEYRNTAYSMISRMKDSGIITENDYTAIHEKLVRETLIEYKRMMASITQGKDNGEYNMYRYDRNIDLNSLNNSYFGEHVSFAGQAEYSLLADILDLSLPLRGKNKTMNEIVGKILRITDNEKRLSLLPVLLKYNIHFDDTVYRTLASSKRTMKTFYGIMATAGKLAQFPKEYLNHRQFILSALHEDDGEYARTDSVVFLDSRRIFLGTDSGIVYLCKFKKEDDDEWFLYLSDALPADTLKLNKPDTKLLFTAAASNIDPEIGVEKMAEDMLFENLLMYTRLHNGGYYDSYSFSRSRSLGGYMWDF